MHWIDSFQTNEHSFLGGSRYAWINYSEDKFRDAYWKYLKREKLTGNSGFIAMYEGTILHEYADDCIKRMIKIDDDSVIGLYVNDAIDLKMRSEQMLFYSRKSFGTCDAISFDNGLLRIHDLKTGMSKASFHQLEIYAAYFCLNYDIAPKEIKMVFRIYQFDRYFEEESDLTKIIPIMDKIITFDRIMFEMGDKE